VWLDDLLVRAFGKVPPYDSDKARVQLIVKTLESSLQVRARGDANCYLVHACAADGDAGRREGCSKGLALGAAAAPPPTA
jgi:hypothetical protein